MSICIRAEFIDRYINQLAVFHFARRENINPELRRARQVIESMTDLRFEISFLPRRCLCDSFVYELSTLIYSTTLEMFPSLRLCFLKIFQNVRALLDMPLVVELCYIRNVSVLFLGYKWIGMSRSSRQTLTLSLFFEQCHSSSIHACHLFSEHKRIYYQRLRS